ncbi:hypothetical protein [Ostreibacterium oceani]|uniref:Uncharacterized protein n=1 Tax=Ostreibacterium oceani TaxID=2654998 RepID=A0A6N7ESF3_9GAMM|nr:hypothetical protein [Ostreibacterium oceani]MPV85774.1 hypothetical protein [Ostreibacterium oceani]
MNILKGITLTLLFFPGYLLAAECRAIDLQNITDEQFQEKFPSLNKSDYKNAGAALVECQNDSGQKGYLGGYLHGPGYVEQISGKKSLYMVVTPGGGAMTINAATLNIVKMSYEGYEQHDVDGLLTTCEVLIDHPLTINKVTRYETDLAPFSEYLAEKAESKTCQESYEITRSLDEILMPLNPKYDDTDFIPAKSNSYYYSRIGRYTAYLKKYPMSADTVQQYTQMAVWLLSYQLHNEAILVATNVVNFDNSITQAYFVLGRGYEALGDNAKANENYKRFVELAQSQGIDIPADIQQRVN